MAALIERVATVAPDDRPAAAPSAAGAHALPPESPDSPVPRVTATATGRPLALVTGASAGIGAVTAIELARQGYDLLLACRDAARTRWVQETIARTEPASRAIWLPLELGDLVSVRLCANAVLAQRRPLHLLVNNAGAAGARGLTVSGFEPSFGVHHLGHFALTQRLLPALRAAGSARIVTVASRAHARADGIDWTALRRPRATLTGVREYAVSKLANVLFSAELARRLAGTGVVAHALHPGVVDSEIWRALPAPLRALNRLRLVPVAEGARTTLHCALADEAATCSGLYWSDGAPAEPSAVARDAALAAALWERSEAWIVP